MIIFLKLMNQHMNIHMNLLSMITNIHHADF